MKKLAIVVTHPIQYYAPVFKLLSTRAKVEVKVLYTWGAKSIEPKYDPGFGKVVKWDIPVLEGYNYEFLENVAKDPGSHHRAGIDNPKIVEAINQFNPSAILVYGWAYKSHLQIIRHFHNKIPIWFRGDSHLLNESGIIKPLLRRLFLKFIYKMVDKAFYVGSRNHDYYKKHGLKQQQLVFAPHAIDNQRFQQINKEEAENIRKDLGIRESDVLVLFAGKFEAVKNPLLLVNAFSSIRRSEVHLLLVGNGVLEDVLKQLVSQKEIGNVHFMDFQNQSRIPSIYHACDLFCLTSLSETWGLAVNEAMAAGKAVLVSDKVGCSVDLVTKKNGDIFRSNDIEDLKKKLNDLCRSKEELRQKGTYSKELIKDWSFEKQVEAFERCL